MEGAAGAEAAVLLGTEGLVLPAVEVEDKVVLQELAAAAVQEEGAAPEVSVSAVMAIAETAETGAGVEELLAAAAAAVMEEEEAIAISEDSAAAAALTEPEDSAEGAAAILGDSAAAAAVIIAEG